MPLPFILYSSVQMPSAFSSFGAEAQTDVTLFFSKRFALLIKMLYPVAIIAPVAASGIAAHYAAAVVGIVAIMAGTFGAGESLTNDLNDGILARVALTPLSPRRMVQAARHHRAHEAAQRGHPCEHAG